MKSTRLSIFVLHVLLNYITQKRQIWFKYKKNAYTTCILWLLFILQVLCIHIWLNIFSQKLHVHVTLVVCMNMDKWKSNVTIFWLTFLISDCWWMANSFHHRKCSSLPWDHILRNLRLGREAALGGTAGRR